MSPVLARNGLHIHEHATQLCVKNKLTGFRRFRLYYLFHLQNGWMQYKIFSQVSSVLTYLSKYLHKKKNLAE
jgi:hypothetical protein